MDRLTRNPYNEEDVDFLLGKFNFVILPILNPDGYEYSWRSDRMWRKTRSVNRDTANCVGTDPNRNWDFHWGEVRASNKPCSDSYQGPQAASEPEVRILQDYLCRNGQYFLAYINLHSYSQVWTSPFAYTQEPAPDYELQDALSGKKCK